MGRLARVSLPKLGSEKSYNSYPIGTGVPLVQSFDWGATAIAIFNSLKHSMASKNG
uniref:Uncharacterized protein n=1 Tax=Desertifilum tharense IPPAS B-1220 TaxID=1781255 RepID=A0ACD5GNT8_9CYAN